MGMKHSKGFTVIETVLFIAISGALVIALLVGTGLSLSTQRYRDSVQTFKSFLQEQYSELTNVRNDRDSSWICTSQAQTEQVGQGVDKGQTDCVLLGRYVAVQGGDITVSTVVARQTTDTVSSDDLEDIRTNYALSVSTVAVDTRQLEWSTKIGWPTAGPDSSAQTGDRTIALLFLRAPSSGNIYTFTSNMVSDTPDGTALKAMIVASDTIPGRAERTICIDPNGTAITDSIAVYIAPYATGPSAIETRSNAIMESLGSESRC